MSGEFCQVFTNSLARYLSGILSGALEGVTAGWGAISPRVCGQGGGVKGQVGSCDQRGCVEDSPGEGMKSLGGLVPRAAEG